MTSVVLVDDHQLFLEGLCSLLKPIENISIMDCCSSGKALLKKLESSCPDIIFLDVFMPEMSGLEVLKEIRERKVDSKVIMLTMENDRSTIQGLLAVGANGYLLKNTSKYEIEVAIEEVMNGETFLMDEVKESLVKGFYSDDVLAPIKLTSREKDVLKLICLELKTHEIADQLYLSVNTIETHRKNLLSKTGSKNIVGLVKFALENNLDK